MLDFAYTPKELKSLDLDSINGNIIYSNSDILLQCQMCDHANSDEQTNNVIPEEIIPASTKDTEIWIYRLSSKEKFTKMTKLENLLQHLGIKNVEEMGLYLPSLKGKLDETQALFVDAFLQNNRLDHVVQLMGYHPQYLECFLRTQQYLMKGDGALPFHFRHYIAIMAASRHMCTYLIHLHEQEFILQGGDPEWLLGMSHVPKKLRDLNELNKLLAHRPWLICKAHIEKLTKSTNSKDNWSISELVQALILMSHYHSLCSFVFGCGIKAEIDHTGGFTYRPPSPVEKNANDVECSSDSSVNSEPEVGIEVLMERMKKLVEEGEEETTEEERVKRFEKVENQSVDIAANTVRPSPKAEVLKYVDDAEYCYQDFAKRDRIEDIPTFRAPDYSWEDHGFALSNRLYMDIGNHLEDKFSVATNMTYYTMGEVCDVDTTAFRRAIWCYIHSLYGIMHDDYNYKQVNDLLERNLKAYIKTMTCYPERLTRKDYDNVMREFKHSEKVHVNIMLLEARFQAELLYALRSVMQYMT